MDGVERCIDEEIPFEIPDNWIWVRLSSISNIIMGSSPKGNSICSDEHYLEFHQGKLYFSEKYINCSNQYTNQITKVAPKDSVLLCVRAPVGEVNITARELCIGRGLTAIIPFSDIQTEFLFYWLQPFKQTLINEATGSTFAAITADTVRNLLIPLPTIPEQQQILNSIIDFQSILNNIETSLN